jgi:hypothetical protein
VNAGDDDFDPELADLLREEAARPLPDEAVKAAVRSELGSILAGPPMGPVPAAPITRPSPVLPAAGKLLVAMLVGGVIGAGIHAKLAAPSVVDRHREVTLPSAVIAPAESASGPVVPVVSPLQLPSVPNASSSTAHASASPRAEGDLAAERRILEIGRTALGRGDGPAAIAALDRHAREYPRGQLVEEREAMAVQALVMAGRNKEAAERAARFRRRFPDSPFARNVDEALR